MAVPVLEVNLGTGRYWTASVHAGPICLATGIRGRITIRYHASETLPTKWSTTMQGTHRLQS